MSDQSLAVRTIKNSILNIASFIVGLGVNFYLLRFVVHELGTELYGLSALLMVIIAPLNLTNLGFGEATTKYVAEFVHLKQYEKAGSYIRTTFLMNLIIGIAGMLLVFFFGGPLAIRLFGGNITNVQHELVDQCMKVIAFGWLINQMAATFMGVPVAVQDFKKVAIGNLIYVASYAVFTYVLLHNGYGLLGFTIASVSAQMITTAFWIYSAKTIMPGISMLPSLDKSAWKQSFHYGGWQTISQLGGILAQQAEKYIMGVLLAVSSVGIYNVVLNIEQKIYSVVHKLAEVLFPMFSAISSDSQERKANILIKSSWIITTVAVTLLVSVIPFAHTLIRLWMKDSPIADQGELVLQVLCLAGAFGSATTAGYFFLLGVGKTQKITYISLITGVVTLVVALMVLPHYGLRGAGIGALAAAMVQSVAISRVMHTALKDVMPLNVTLTAVFSPIITGTMWSVAVTLLCPYHPSNWFALGGAYLLMAFSTMGLIYLVTRFLPHGKEHEELLRKLYVHGKQKITARFTK